MKMIKIRHLEYDGKQKKINFHLRKYRIRIMSVFHETHRS